MLSLSESYDLLKKKIPVDMKIASAIETDDVYEFHVVDSVKDPDYFSNDFYCSVNKETGAIEDSAVLTCAMIFDPSEYDILMKTMTIF